MQITALEYVKKYQACQFFRYYRKFHSFDRFLQACQVFILLLPPTSPKTISDILNTTKSNKNITRLKYIELEVTVSDLGIIFSR